MTYATIDTNTGELFLGEQHEEVGPRPVLSAEELLEQLTRLNREINTRKEDIKQLIKDTKFHKKHNPAGIPADEVKQISKTAVRVAARDYEEKRAEALEFFAAYERLTNYDD